MAADRRVGLSVLAGVVLAVGLVGSAAVASAVAGTPHQCQVKDQAQAGKPYGSLQDAVDAAVPGDTLLVKGTCDGATVVLDKDLTVVGRTNPGFGPATLDAQGSGIVITIGSPDHPNTPVVSLSGLTITGGGLSGILNYGTLDVSDSTVTGNAAAGLNNAGAVTADDVTITANGAAGILNRAGSLTISGSTVSGNTNGGDGGGIFNDAFLTMTDSVVAGNTSSGDGGGLFNLGTATLSGVTIQDNSSAGEGGGLASHAAIDLNGTTIEGNTAGLGGGGVFNSLAGSGSMAGSTVTGNTALDGEGHGWGVGGGVTDCASDLSLQSVDVSANVPDDFGISYCPGVPGLVSP